jgi:hypothetical protein
LINQEDGNTAPEDITHHIVVVCSVNTPAQAAALAAPAYTLKDMGGIHHG